MVTVVSAVERDLAALAKREPGIDGCAEAATALALAAELDAGNSATSKSMCARALTETMERLRAMAPPETVASPLDEIRARRDLKVRKSA